MATVGVRELRQNLSVYLARVKRGETLTVTERGAVVAMLRPPEADAPLGKRLVTEGRARPATRTAADLPRPLKARGNITAIEVLLDARDDRR